jgi:hypothetical protein
MNVIVKPKTRWAKNRCTEHGNVFKVLRKMFVKGKEKILLESLEKSWRQSPDVVTHWCGWFCEEDAEIVQISENCT